MVKLLLIVFVMFSQLVADDDLSAYKSLKSLESTLESGISNELKLYTTSPFNVNVKVVLDRIQTTENSIKKQSLPGAYQSGPNEVQQSGQSLKNELNHIEVLITLDEGVDPSIVSIARRIAYEKANLSDIRGDKVIIREQPLRIKKKSVEASDNVLSKIEELDKKIANLGVTNLKNLQNVEKNFQNIEKNFQKKLDLNKKENSLATQKTLDTISRVKENNFYWIIFVVAAFIIFSYLVFVYLSNVFKNQRENVRNLDVKLDQDINAVKNQLQEKIEEVGTSKTPDVDQQLINDLSTLLIARKNSVKMYIKRALRTSDGEEKVALLAQVLGTKAMTTLFFKEEDILKEVFAVSNQYHFEPEQRESLSNDLYKELLEKTNDQNSQEFDEFAFVKNMDIEQLLLLLEGEDNGIQAFILTQVEKVVSAKVLSRLDENLRLKLLVELANMRPINAQTYSAISKKLSLKIATSPKINHFVVNGESEMATQILYLPPKEQSSMLNKLLTQDAGLYNRIKNTYVFAEDVAKLDSSLVKTLLLTLNDSDIALSLYQFKTELQQKLLAEVNERKMVMIDEKIKQLENENPSSEKMSLALYNFLTEATNLRKHFSK